jgi:hypothetical protein
MRPELAEVFVRARARRDIQSNAAYLEEQGNALEHTAEK